MKSKLAGAIGGRCDVCEAETGNLAKHRPACARRHGRIPSTVPLTHAQEALIWRSGAHALRPQLLTAENRLQGGVNELALAGLLYRLERGEVITMHGSRVWRGEGAPTYSKPSLSRVVAEAWRLGLAYPVSEHLGGAVYRTRLVPGLTHARWALDPTRPTCGGHHPQIKRFRLLNMDHLMYVDCQACLDKPRSCVYVIPETY